MPTEPASPARTTAFPAVSSVPGMQIARRKDRQPIEFSSRVCLRSHTRKLLVLRRDAAVLVPRIVGMAAPVSTRSRPTEARGPTKVNLAVSKGKKR